MKPVLHIGPPKTATTSLQESVIPHLGRPYQVKPDWVRNLTDSPVFASPALLPPGVIISDERIGGFMKFSPDVIAARFAQVFKSAQVIYVARDPVALFYSLYRQTL